MWISLTAAAVPFNQHNLQLCKLPLQRFYIIITVIRAFLIVITIGTRALKERRRPPRRIQSNDDFPGLMLALLGLPCPEIHVYR